MILALSIVVLLGIFLTLLGIFSLLRRSGYSHGESFSYAVVIYLSVYSVIIQVLFICGIHDALYIIDVAVVIISISLIVKNSSILTDSARVFSRFFLTNKVYTIPFTILFLYLFFQVLLLPPNNYDSMVYNLSRVLMMQQEGSLFLKNFSAYRQVNLPVGFDILAFMFLRFHSDYFLAIFSFLTYSAVIVSTYTLVNKVFNDSRLSLVTTIITGSLIEIVLQSTSTKNDLPVAALGTVVFLAASTYLKNRDKFSLLIVATCLLLGLTFKGYYAGFAIPFAIFFLILIIKEHGLRDILLDVKLLMINYAFFLWVPVLILVCLLTFSLRNYLVFGELSGHPEMVDINIQKDGLKGAGLNIGRYWVQSLNLPTNLGGKYLDKLHGDLLGENRFRATRMDVQDTGVKLSTSIWPFEDSSWFGPLGFFLVFPAVIYSLSRGEKIIRLVSLSLLSFFLSMSYILCWIPWNNRFFSLFFAGSGICVAFFLNRLINKKYYTFLVFLSIFFFSYAALFNINKPFFNNYEIGYYINQNIIKVGDFENKKQPGYRYPGWYVFNWVQYARNRDLFYDQHFDHQGVAAFKKLAKAGKRVLVLADCSWVFPFLLTRPDLSVTVADMTKIYHDNKYYNLKNQKDFDFIKNRYDYLVFIDNEPVKFLRTDQLIANYKNQYNSFYLFDISH